MEVHRDVFHRCWMEGRKLVFVMVVIVVPRATKPRGFSEEANEFKSLALQRGRNTLKRRKYKADPV